MHGQETPADLVACTWDRSELEGFLPSVGASASRWNVGQVFKLTTKEAAGVGNGENVKGAPMFPSFCRTIRVKKQWRNELGSIWPYQLAWCRSPLWEFVHTCGNAEDRLSLQSAVRIFVLRVIQSNRRRKPAFLKAANDGRCTLNFVLVMLQGSFLLQVPFCLCDGVCSVIC